MRITIGQLKRVIRETAGESFLDGPDDEGAMALSRLRTICDTARELEGMLSPGDQLPAWVQDLLAGAHRDMGHIRDYMVGLRGEDDDEG